ncbi:hypothetical protein HDU96_009360 [Phlyctochytrium bullatum]|nr:hypothetical protein HDU96_009360 [Phlyctochytrium bullatum]
MHVLLIEEQLRLKDLKRLILFAAVKGETRKRMSSLLKTESILMPKYDFSRQVSSLPGTENDAVWKKLQGNLVDEVLADQATCEEEFRSWKIPRLRENLWPETPEEEEEPLPNPHPKE